MQFISMEFSKILLWKRPEVVSLLYGLYTYRAQISLPFSLRRTVFELLQFLILLMLFQWDFVYWLDRMEKT